MVSSPGAAIALGACLFALDLGWGLKKKRKESSNVLMFLMPRHISSDASSSSGILLVKIVQKERLKVQNQHGSDLQMATVGTDVSVVNS